MSSSKALCSVSLLHLFIVVCLVLQCFATKKHVDLTTTLTVNASDASGKPIPDTLFGIFFEIRVSSMISNGEIILNVDYDMYSNSQSLRDALCFFMDEVKGHEITYVQTPQCFENVTKNDLYGGALRVIYEVEFHGLDALGGPFYIGTGCFHRREILCGRKFNDQYKNHWWFH